MDLNIVGTNCYLSDIFYFVLVHDCYKISVELNEQNRLKYI